MRVLHLIETGGPGGAENILISLVEKLDSRFESVVGLIHMGWVSAKLVNSGVKVIALKTGKLHDAKLLSCVYRTIKQERIELIHSHLLDMSCLSAIAAAAAGVPHITTEHGDIHHVSRKLTVRTLLKAKILAILSNKIVFVSKFTRDKFVDITGMHENKSCVIYNGVDLSTFEKPVNVQEKRAEIGIRESDLIVGNVANLYPVKGQTYLLKAAKQVINQIPNAKFIFIGRGPLEEELKREAHSLGIGSSVKFLNYREDVKDLLKIMNIFVLTSLSEGMPVSMIEAMASKVPVIATSVGGIPEVIQDGLNGYIVTPSDPSQLANRMSTLLKNEDIAQNFATAGYNKVRDHLTLQSMITKYAVMYNLFIKKQSPRCKKPDHLS